MHVATASLRKPAIAALQQLAQCSRSYVRLRGHDTSPTHVDRLQTKFLESLYSQSSLLKSLPCSPHLTCKSVEWSVMDMVALDSFLKSAHAESCELCPHMCLEALSCSRLLPTSSQACVTHVIKFENHNCRQED